MSHSSSPVPVGELLVAGFEGTSPSAEIRRLIREDRLGGVILYGKNCVDPYQVLELTNALQRCARETGAPFPLLVAIDQEHGRVARLRKGMTLFPSMGEVARAGDPSLVRRMAGVISRELLALGVNWNLAPVADVLSAEGCPVGDRSFGHDHRQVGRMVSAYVDGAEEAGMISCLKHFPGHGGTDADSHFSCPEVGRSLADIEKVDLAPFREGVASGAPAVMTTHITFPALDPALPATFSEKILDGLLRRRLDFRGVIVSDDLEMAGAAAKYSLAEGALHSLRAGADMVLVSGMLLPERNLPALMEDLARAAVDGELPPARVESALARTRKMKERYLTGTGIREPEGARKILRCQEHLSLAREVGTRISREED